MEYLVSIIFVGTILYIAIRKFRNTDKGKDKDCCK